jgi:hypothetical protein
MKSEDEIALRYAGLMGRAVVVVIDSELSGLKCRLTALQCCDIDSAKKYALENLEKHPVIYVRKKSKWTPIKARKERKSHE